LKKKIKKVEAKRILSFSRGILEKVFKTIWDIIFWAVVIIAAIIFLDILMQFFIPLCLIIIAGLIWKSVK